MNHTGIPLSVYLEEVRNRVCALCSQKQDEEECSVSGSAVCTVERNLPVMIDIAHRLESSDIDTYIRAFKKEICIHCKQEGLDVCGSAKGNLCGLDSYFPLIIEAIEAVDCRAAAH